jgi:hypothetical protein
MRGAFLITIVDGKLTRIDDLSRSVSPPITGEARANASHFSIASGKPDEHAISGA